MLTVPRIVSLPARPYAAIRTRITMDEIMKVSPQLFGEIWGWVDAANAQPTGMTILKYNVVDMAGIMELEYGVSTAASVTSDERVLAGTLPAGRYATITHTGAYDQLYDANAVLIGWAKERDIEWDTETKADGDHFACRYEDYRTDPQAEPDPQKWVVDVAIKIRD
ncbi:MAG: GyrI-like domain-containing protein [Rhizobiaceae bacterium]